MEIKDADIELHSKSQPANNKLRNLPIIREVLSRTYLRNEYLYNNIVYLNIMF